MARSGRSRFCALAALGALAALWPQSPRCAVLSNYDAEVEGGGAVRTARKMKALRTTLKFLKENSGRHIVGSQFDTNAIGESWGRSAMGHWVDRAGADTTAERLEEELMALKVGRRTESQRQAMRMKRMARMRELRSRVSRPVNAMFHWTDRPSTVTSPEMLEEELMATKIGGLLGHEGARGAMRMKRMARQQEVRSLAPTGPAAAARSAPIRQHDRPKQAMLFNSQYDANAIGEGFRGKSSGERLEAERLERQLAAFKVGRQGVRQGRREEMRLRRKRAAQ